MAQSQIEVEHHPPERTCTANVLGSVCCSCCCCCCCLHTAGALIGAAVGSGWAMHGQAKSSTEGSGWPSESSAIGAYWLVVVATSFLVFAGTAIGAGFGWAAGVLVLGLPVIQVVAAGFALIAVLVMPVKDRRHAALAIGKVSLISVVAFIVAVALMAAFGGAALALT